MPLPQNQTVNHKATKHVTGASHSQERDTYNAVTESKLR